MGKGNVRAELRMYSVYIQITAEELNRHVREKVEFVGCAEDIANLNPKKILLNIDVISSYTK